MSANGAALFLGVALVTLYLGSGQLVPIEASMLAAFFVLSLGRHRATTALRRAIFTVAPVAIFLFVVWVVFVGRAPTVPLVLYSMGSSNAELYVLAISTRLFVLAALIFSLLGKFHDTGPLHFLGALALPPRVKTLLLTTLSLKYTLEQAARRAHTALVAAAILTPKFSVKNVFHSIFLLRATWTSTLAMALERMDDKWKWEKIPSDDLFDQFRPKHLLGAKDLLWLVLALGALVATEARRGFSSW